MSVILDAEVRLLKLLSPKSAELVLKAIEDVVRRSENHPGDQAIELRFRGGILKYITDLSSQKVEAP